LIAVCAQGALYVTEHARLGIFWAKGSKQTGLLFERWNTFSRIRVVDWPHKEPFGWAYGHNPTGKYSVDQKYIDIDADAGTIITHYDGNLDKLGFLANDVVNMGYHIRPVESAAIIGVGGGRDVMAALYFKVRKIVALELNPAIVEALTKRFSEFAGNFM